MAVSFPPEYIMESHVAMLEHEKGNPILTRYKAVEKQAQEVQLTSSKTLKLTLHNVN